ncbi:MAG: amidase [Hyphomicrobiaceae bacterium]|nr:amidase [Hyphomicrobiaceae bacterium]
MILGKALHELSIAEAGTLLRSGAVKSTALAEHALARIERHDPTLRSFILVARERALADAEAADQDFAAGIDRGPMQGIPYALKDIYDTAGMRTTCHSKLLVDNVPATSSVVEQRLSAGGGVLLGKLGTHEFAYGGPSFDLPFPPARNPWNSDCVTGGSSSGSGAAVAAGFVRMAMGSDTGGSIRGPAAYCGTVGLKPTYGLVSRRGVFPLSYTLDHCGPLAWSVEDAAITMQVIAGHDPADPGSASVPVPDFRSPLGLGVEGLRIAVPRHFYAGAPGASREVIDAIDRTLEDLARNGAVVEEVRLSDYAVYNACGRIIITAEAYAIHEQDLRRRPLDYGRYTFMRMALGATLSAADLTQALRLRRELAIELNKSVLGSFDALITASALTPAPRFDAIDPATPPTVQVQTMPFNVTGNPSMSVPIGLSRDGLPLSLQVVGRPFDEPTVLRIGAEIERVTGWTGRHPELP